MMAVNEVFARQLRRAMDEAGVTSKELREALGVSEGTMARWRSGERHAGRKNLPRLARYLGKPVAYFSEEEPAPVPASSTGIFNVGHLEDHELLRIMERVVAEVRERLVASGR